MPFIVPLGNRQGGEPTIDVSQKPRVVTLQCCCRSFPKIIEITLGVIAVGFVSTCGGVIIHKTDKGGKPVPETEDDARYYLAITTFFICVAIMVGICFGYCIEGVKKMLRHETMLLVLCGGLCIISGGLALDAVINHQLWRCSDKSSGIAGGVVFVVLGAMFFLDAFVTHKMQPPTTQSVVVQQNKKTKHLPAKSRDVVYVSSPEKYKMDFIEEQK